MSKQSNRNRAMRGTPVRSLRVPDKFWKQWFVASRIAGVDRTKFIITVVNHAAEVIMKNHKIASEEEPDSES